MKQLPNFYSWRPDSEAVTTDTFNQDWAQTRGFTNPLWCLIAHCLSQIKRQMARVVIITPLWASQPWYATILGMLEDYPRILPAKEDLVILPTCQVFIMSQGVLELVAWPISGSPLHHEIRGFSPSPRIMETQNTVKLQLLVLNGLAGVHRGIEIPLWDL